MSKDFENNKITERLPVPLEFIHHAQKNRLPIDDDPPMDDSPDQRYGYEAVGSLRAEKHKYLTKPSLS